MKPTSGLRYQLDVFGGLRKRNTLYSRQRDMAAAPFPRLIQLQTINACNAACAMCPYPVFKDVFPRGRMDDALFDRVTDEIARHPEVKVFIPMLQNEPFLDRRIFEKVKRFKATTGGRVRVELVTNGAFLTEENVAKIADSGLDVVDVSLDALSREVYGRVRVGLDYDRVLAGVERLLAAKLPATSVFMRLVKVRDNVHEVRAFARAWRRRGVPVFMYTANNRAGAVAGFDETQRIPDAEIPLRSRVGRRLVRAWMGHCPIPFSSAYILHDGSMILCAHDWGRRELLGNVRDASIAEIWNGERMREIRALVSERRYAEVPACAGCSLWKDGWF
ncbi:MAG TPA: radical SAM protein [Gemmatimonadaceae bacterium]|nr:radical SAM protein [Gemmatimonadaceae bacterium]